MDEPLETHKCNAAATLNILIAAEEHGARRVVYASSASIYGDTPDAVIREDSPKPISPFAVSKLAAEHYCRVWSKPKGLPTVSLRFFNVFGPGQRVNAKYAPGNPLVCRCDRGVRPPGVHGDGEQTRDFIYIGDLAVDSGSRFVCGITGRWRDVVDATLSATGHKRGLRHEHGLKNFMNRSEPVLTEPRVADIRRTHADVSRAHDLLKWAPEKSWSGALKATVDWFDQSQRA